MHKLTKSKETSKQTRAIFDSSSSYAKSIDQIYYKLLIFDNFILH